MYSLYYTAVFTQFSSVDPGDPLLTCPNVKSRACAISNVTSSKMHVCSSMTSIAFFGDTVGTSMYLKKKIASNIGNLTFLVVPK